MTVLHKINMDIVRKERTQRIEVMQEDGYCRTLQLQLYANGTKFSPGDDVSVLIRFVKADGTGGIYDTLPTGEQAWGVSGNVVTVRLAPQVCTAPGDVQVTVILLREEAQLHCFAVTVHVHPLAIYQGESCDYSRVTGFLPQPDGAIAGNVLMISEVDTQGFVTGVEAVDLAQTVEAMVDAYMEGLENGAY